MSEQKPPDGTAPPTEATALAVVPEVEKRLEDAVKNLPEPQRREVTTSIHELMAYVERSGPKIDAETAKILADSADKDNEFRFKYLTQKQKDAADQNIREHELETVRHRDRVRVFWPILITVLVAVVGCLGIGIWLASHDNELLGTGLITGTAFAVAGYLAGVGTANFFKGD